MNAPGIAFVAVADDVFLVAYGLGHGAPLQAGGIAAAAASAQSAFGDLLDHVVGRHLRQRLHQRPIAVARDVVVDVLRIDVTGVLEHHMHLLVEMVAQVALQLGNRVSTEAADNRFGVLRLDMLVERFFRVDQNEWSGGT